jgi:hypothetical protein
LVAKEKENSEFARHSEQNAGFPQRFVEDFRKKLESGQ